MKSFISLLIVIFFSSCSIKWDVQKRKYNKGFHWSFVGKSHQSKKSNQLTFEKNTKINTTNATESFSQTIAPEVLPELKVASQSQSTCKEKCQFAVLSPSKNFFQKTESGVEHKIKPNKKYAMSPDKEKRVPGTVLFILVCVLAGLFTVAGIGYLILYLSTSAVAYLIFAAISAGLAALFFFIMNGMNQVE